MNARPSHGVVCLPLLDLRTRPEHRAELASQLLMGEIVRVLVEGAPRGWCRVCNAADGYCGWVRDWGLVRAAAARVAGWKRLAVATVAAPFVSVQARPGTGGSVSPLFHGGRVIPGRRSGRYRQVELPDARRGWVPESSLRMAGATAPSLEKRVETLFGTPYMWGGRSPAGYDCSGFVQQVLLEQGVALPRDAQAQFRASRPLGPREVPAVGDLAFFSAKLDHIEHVGLAMGDRYFSHCRGVVRINSIDQDNPLCDKELLPQFRGWGRPRKKWGPGPLRG